MALDGAQELQDGETAREAAFRCEMEWSRAKWRFDLTVLAVKCVSLILLAAIMAWAFSKAAGKVTEISMFSDVAARIQADRWIAWLVAVLFGAGYAYERAARKGIVSRYHQLRERYEREHDPTRSLSEERGDERA
mgnify:CR=1 FL=1